MTYLPPPVCGGCGKVVLGYTWSVRFAFINGVREALMDEVLLDCGCVLSAPDMECEPSDVPGCALLTFIDFTGSPVMSFYDRFEEVG